MLSPTIRDCDEYYGDCEDDDDVVVAETDRDRVRDQIRAVHSNFSPVSMANLGRPYLPVDPLYIDETSRRDTFATADGVIRDKRRDLAEAGFYYTGVEDRTKCYHCGGIVFMWEADNDPWEEHAKFLPTCYFLRCRKGQSYVRRVGREHGGTDRIAPDQHVVGDGAAATDEGRDVVDGKESSRYACKICLDEPVGILFLPCGHLSCCTKCAPNLIVCPICRVVVTEAIRPII